MANDLLYHYTDGDGLLGILNSEEIWATDIEFLNDSTEFRYAVGLVLEDLRYRAEVFRAGGDPAQGARADIMLNAVSELERGLGLQVEIDGSYHAGPGAYVACFSEVGDALGQWRGYGRGGFSIGFDRDELSAAIAAVRGYVVPPELRQVLYGLTAAKPDLDALVRNLAPAAIGFPGMHGHHEAWKAVPVIATVKDPAFADEREWRLITTGGDPVEFRNGPLSVVPFVRIPVPSTAIRRVVVGPGPHPDLRRNAARQVLARRGYVDVPVDLSEVPYRPSSG